MIEGVQQVPEGTLGTRGEADVAKVPNPPMPPNLSPASSSSSSFTFVSDPFLVLDNDLDDVSEVIKHNIMTDESSGDSTPSHSHRNKCSDNETPTDKRWIQMEMTPPNSFDPCKEREIGQIVSLLQQPDPPSLEEHSPQHLQPQFVLNNDHLEYLSAGISGLEARMPPQGMFTGQKDPMISGGSNGMSPILQLKSHHLTGEQFCDMGIELEQCPQQQHVVLQHHHNVHYSHNNMPFPTSQAIDGTSQIQHFVVQDNGTVILDNVCGARRNNRPKTSSSQQKGIHMESPPPLVLEQQQNIKEEMLFAPSDNAFGHHRSLQVVVEHAPYEQRAEASDVVKNELIRLLLEMSPQELEQLRTQRALEYQQHQQQLLYSQQQKFQTQTCHPQQLQLEHPLVQLQNISPAQQLQHKYSSNGTEHNMLLIHASSSNSFCPSGSINSPTLTSPNAFQSVAPSEYFGEEDSAVEEICWTEGETAMDTSREEDALVGVERLTEAAQRHNDGTTPTGRRRGHKTERRTAHNLIEKKYRCSINDRINQLKEMLSTEESANKLSKSATLRRAVDHIFALRTKNSELGRENVRLRKTLQMAGLAPPERQTMALVKQEVRIGELRTTGNGVLQNKAPRGGVASMRRSNTVGNGGSITSGQAKDQSRVTLCVFMFLLLAFNPLSTLFYTNEAADGSEQYLQHNIGTSAEPGIFVHHRTLLGDDRFSAAFSEGSVPLASSSPSPLSSSSPGGWWPVRPFFRHSLIWLLNSLFVFLILTRLLVYGEPVADRHFLCSTANCRRRAEMAVASGNYKEAQRELGESLKILQRPLPFNGSVDEWMSLTWQIIRHLLNGLWIGRWFARRRRPSVPHQSVCRSHAATALVYHQLHQLHLLDVDGIRLTSRGALNLALLATNLAESAGSPAIPHSFRAEIYLCAALRSILCMPKCLRRVVAAYFFRRAKRHTRKSADLEGCRLNAVQWTFHPLARQFLSCTERVGAILSQSGVQKTPNFPFSAFAQPPKPLEVLKDAFKMHLLGQLLCRLESSDGGTLRLADFVEQSQLLLNICEGGNAGGAELTAEEPKNEGKMDGDYDVPSYTDKDMLRPILIAEGDELCAWWTYLVTGGLHWRHGDSVRAQRHYSLVRKFPRELAQNDLALAVGLAFCTRKMCFEDREKDTFAEVVVWHVRRANAHLKRDDWPTMGRDRAGTLEGMLPRGKAPDGSVSILKKKFRILCCQWLLCSLLDVWSFRFAHCGLVAPLEVRRLYAEVMGRIGREGEANEEKMAMFRELGKTLCGLHQIGNQLSALQEGNAPDGGGPTKSNAPRQPETEDA